MNSPFEDPHTDRNTSGDSPEEFLRDLLRRTGGRITAEGAAEAREEYGIPRSTALVHGYDFNLFRLFDRDRK